MPFTDSFVKEAITALRRHLMAKPMPQRIQAIKALPAGMGQTQAYKELGSQAASMASRMPGGAGHGAGHVFEVTKGTQGLMAGAPTPPGVDPLAARRRATLGALTHDVGREAESGVKARMPKAQFQQTPGAWHSETGGRYAKHLLGGQNKPLAQMVPGLQQGQLSNVVRAHDTDITAHKPWVSKVRQQDPAAGSVYTADKLTGIGASGAARTVAMGRNPKHPETPQQTWAFSEKNIPKYQKVISSLTPQQQVQYQPKLQQYRTHMRYYRRFGKLPGEAPAQPMQAPAAPAVKTAMAARDFQRLYEHGVSGKITAKQMKRLVDRLALKSKSPTVAGEMFGSIYMLPIQHRQQLLDMMTEGLGKALKSRPRGWALKKR